LDERHRVVFFRVAKRVFFPCGKTGVFSAWQNGEKSPDVP
jgi:hypothetical protein